MQTLVDKFNTLSEEEIISKDISNFVISNLRKDVKLREYQEEAIARLKYYIEKYKNKQLPVHLLFHMATGSGKTMLMASNILYLYEKGYRNFVFFVNSTNIIEKTRANFLDKGASKYLFAEKIIHDGKEVQVEEVENFETANSENINIHFTTIQGLHSRLNAPQEEAITYEDFDDLKIVFLSDEAHHINTLTKSIKQLSKGELEESRSWEGTINRILKSNKENIMLEYTATVELGNQAVSEKYADKIIYQYSLREFREDGYSKEVHLLQSDMDMMDRVLQAVILSQYRRKTAENHKLNLKPIILFKSRLIEDSGQFRDEFVKMINNLKKSDINRIAKNVEGTVMEKVFEYFEKIKLSPENLIEELKEDFSEEKILSVNSSTDADSRDIQLKVNSLEDYNNEIRAVFTVNMLNEGWDVLNLFDIVRLYETRDSRNGKAGSTTIAEAQLIGRGARYNPFKIEEEQELFKRKYDKDPDNDLRILEELHYHSQSDSKYIQEIKQELVRTGISAPDESKKRITVSIKDEIQKTKFWKEGVIFINKKVKTNTKDIKSLSEVLTTTLFKQRFASGGVIESDLLDSQNTRGMNENVRSEMIKFSSIEKHILRKAIDKNKFYKFDNLKRYLGNIESIDEFLTSSKYAGSLDIEIKGTKEDLENFDNQMKFRIARRVFDDLAGMIEANISEFKGTNEFEGHKISTQAKTKTMEIVVNNNPSSDKEYGVAMSVTNNDDLKLDLSQEDWYMYDENYGTSEEKYLVHFIRDSIDSLREKYEDIYLLRNESLFKIYRFSDGRATEPDFVLFLKEKDSKKQMSYQLFIEPKGGDRLTEDSWKSEFLQEIENQFIIENMFESDKYKLIGLPFYNESITKDEFSKEFKKKLKI
jgi:type III restriction enzyme